MSDLNLTEQQQTVLDAKAFQQLLTHLREHPEVQNIDLMNLADFCRNCLAKWWQAAAEQEGLSVDKAEAREYVYGMTYEEWKTKHQTPLD